MRTQRLLVAVAGLAASLLAPTLALAWNEAGHMTSAKLAWDRLGAAEQKAIGELLAQHPLYDTMLVEDVPAGVDKGEWAFLKASSWPDAVRPANAAYPTYKPPQVTQYHRSNWHYKDMPYSPDGTYKAPAEPANTTVNPGAEPADALAALAWNRAILADASKPAAERAVAMCWVQHLIGDIHQPLHGCTMYSKDYPKGDQGGNAQTVTTESGVQNLHTIWDNALGTANNYAGVAALARDLQLDPRADVAKLKEYADHKEAEQWLGESNKLAVAFVYLDGKLKTAPSRRDRSATTPTATSQPAEPPRLPLMYMETANMVARQREALAGARLADAIQAALGK